MSYQFNIKIKNLIPIVLFTLILGCKFRSDIEPKIIYSGYYIPVEGGRINIKLDSITPLNKLIFRLKVDNKLYETNKGYLIGFNDLMFSIAIHSTKAIQPLLNFIDTTESIDAKMGAIYTLYLIGIDCKVEWQYDDCVNVHAREALLKLLAKEDGLQEEIMLLLIRDPRERDVPRLFNILDSLKSDCWPITNGLLRYDLKNIPVKQNIPDSLNSMRIIIPEQMKSTQNELFIEIFLKFAQKYRDFICVEDTLYHYDFYNLYYGIDDNEVYIRYLTNNKLWVGHGMIGTNYNYYYSDGKIHFCSASTSKKRWLDWWDSQSIAYKDSLANGNKKIIVNRL